MPKPDCSYRSLLLLLTALILFGLSSCTQDHGEVVLKFNTGWEFAQVDSSIWRTAQVPGSVQQDLIAYGLIRDPIIDTAEYELSWVEEADWLYKKQFSKTDLADRPWVYFDFGGLDTYAHILLNGDTIGENTNMFTPRQIRVSRDDLEETNELLISFASVMKEGRTRGANQLHGKTAGNDSGKDQVSPFVRKAPYQFGWDWGPRAVTTGIWRDVNLICTTDSTWSGEKNRPTSPYADNFGAIKLVREKDSIGTSFYFTKDGAPLFIRGANYIPQSIFPARVSDDDYRNLLYQVKAANINMLRVWGGGIYEKEIFYDLCDSLGIMVWQDFMFAGAMYPTDEDFLAAVREEVAQQVQRLSHHPCVVQWCGNNEVDVAWQNWGWQTVMQQDSAVMQANYDLLFKETIGGQLNPSYVHTSPLSNWGTPENFNHHNMHYWGVWHGPDDFSGFQENVPRFMSEYGFQSFPMPETFEGQIPDMALSLDHPLILHRQKSYKGTKELSRHMAMHYEVPTNFKKYCYVSQLNQALAMEMAINAHRFSNGHCMGTMYWQLNDVWAGPTWSTIDHAGNWKAAHYAVKDRYADVALTSEENKDSMKVMLSNLSKSTFEGVLSIQHGHIGAPVNSAQHSCFDPNPSQFFSRYNSDTNITILPDKQYQFMESMSCEHSYFPKFGKTAFYIRFILKDSTENVLNEWVHYFVEPKEMSLEQISSDQITVTPLGQNRYAISSPVFIKNLFISSPDVKGEVWSDNYFDLFAGEIKKVELLTKTSNEAIRIELMGLNLD